MTDVAEVQLEDPETTRDAAGTKGERTRQRILDIAIDRFGHRGYRGTSVSEIARAAGLTQAASYAYFESKESLFRAAVDADASALIDEVTNQVLEVDTHALVAAVLIYAVLTLETHPLAHRVLSGHEPDEVPRLIELPAVRRIGNLFTDRLTHGQAEGTVRADLDPEIVGAGIETLIVALLFSSVQSRGSANNRAQTGVVEAFDLIIRPATAVPTAH